MTALFPGPLLDGLAAAPDRAAIEHGDRTVTGAELLATVGRLATALADAGLGPGLGVAMHTAVTPEAFAAHLAAHALGCRVVGVRPGWTQGQLGRVLARGIDAVVVDPSTGTSDGDGPVRLSLGPVPGARDLLAAAAGAAGPVAVLARPDDVARLDFTSGSTGRPRACARSYRTFSLAYRPDRWSPGLTAFVGQGERFLIYGSLAMPVMLTFAGRTLLTGGTVAIAGDDVRDALAPAIARLRATRVAMTPPSLQLLLERLGAERLDVSCLGGVMVTGSPAGPGLLAAAVVRLGPVVWQGYGQAESGMISLLTPDELRRHGHAALTSVGRVLPEVDVRVDDDGEIWVRSEHVMAGYWDDPAATAEVLRDGWLRTRDVGAIDPATGLLHLTGRARDVILVNAEVCYAGAIEGVLARHPLVGAAYAVGVPDARTGEAVHAFVVPSGDATPDSEELVRLVRADLTANHVPRSVTVVREVPVAAGGKPDKRALAELAAGHLNT
jgi:acyl-CoA synthetase (AMP-forming)/AMP-acid ligase II